MSAPANIRTPIEGWDQRAWPDGVPPCPRCGHDGTLETIAQRRRAITDEEHDELVDALLAGTVEELRPWQAGAHADALVAAYVALVHEWVGLALDLLADDEIREALEVMVLTVPPAVLVDVRETLNRTVVRYAELGIVRTPRPRPVPARRAAA